MKKVDQIGQLLDQQVRPPEIAREVGCALSLVYTVRGRREMSLVKHQIVSIEQQLAAIRERLRRLEGDPVDVIERLLGRK